MPTKLYTTAEAAKLAQVSRPTIQYWIATEKIKAPALRIHNRRAARLWTAAAVEKMRDLAKTLKPGPSPKKANDSKI
jgi:excisionase family DNA binding protein